MKIKNNQVILDKNFDRVLELHNLTEDQLEQNNLLHKYPDKVKELTALREAFYKTMPSSICSPEMIEAWQKDFTFHEDRLRQKHNIEDKKHTPSRRLSEPLTLSAINGAVDQN